MQTCEKDGKVYYNQFITQMFGAKAGSEAQ